MVADPVRRTDPHYYIDRYRTKHERGRGARHKLCYPGRGGCNGYSFPHRRGSLYCFHNPNITEQQLRAREESGAWS